MALFDGIDHIIEFGAAPPPRLRSAPIPPARDGLPTDHPALMLLREVAELRGQLRGRDDALATAYERECELVRVLHRYVLREQDAGS